MRKKIWTSGKTEWALFALLFFSAANFQHTVEYDNTSSRFFLLSSVVDFHRVDLEMFRADTIDLAEHGGRYYTNKPFGLPLLAAPVYWAMRRFTVLKKLGPLSNISAYLTRVWAVSLPYALMGPILFHLLLDMGLGEGDAFLAVLAYALGTLAWLHASLFSGHETAASLSFFSFASCWRMSRKKSSEAWRWFGAGLLAGLAALCEYQAAFIALLLFFYVLWRARGVLPKLAFGAGLGVCAILLGAYDYICFGAPWSLSQANQGVNFADYLQHGFLGVELPHWNAAWRLLISPSRGLFFTMPVLALALPGFVKLWHKGESWRAEVLLIATMLLGQWAITSGYVGWHAGWSFGPRYFVSTLPFLAIPLAFGMDRLWFVPLFVLSVGQMAIVQLVMPHTPQYIENPMVELLLPLYRDGYLSGSLGTLLGFSGFWPLVLWLTIVGALVIWAWPESGPFVEDPTPSAAQGAAFGLLYCSILIALAAVHSPEKKQVQGYVVKLLSDYDAVGPSHEVEAAIAREEKLRMAMVKAAAQPSATTTTTAAQALSRRAPL